MSCSSLQSEADATTRIISDRNELLEEYHHKISALELILTDDGQLLRMSVVEKLSLFLDVALVWVARPHKADMATESFEIINDSLSWPTRLSRTRVTSVQCISLGESPNSANFNLDDVLHTVQRLGLRRCRYDEIENLMTMGEGGSFRVDKCIYEKNTVAVKHIKFDADQKDRHGLNRRLRAVLNDILIMHHAPLREHPNVLSILGYGWRQLGQTPLPYIVVEYATYGSLRHYLAESQRSLRTKIILAGDVAAGLNALHQCGIVHGDLKLENVVVLQSWDRPPGAIAKLCDFGHSIVLAADKKHMKYYGTVLYNAPEVDYQDLSLIQPGDLPKCDMWAYGLALWEIFQDGARFFKRSWLDEVSFAKSWPESLLTDAGRIAGHQVGDIESLSGVSPLGAGDRGKTLFKRFDPGHLSGLATKFINSLKFGGGFVDKAIIRKFLNQALQVNPKDRPSKITLGPLMGTWNPADVNTLRAKLSIHTGSAAWSFNLLRPDQEKEILWEHQSQILHDFEEISKRHKSSEDAASAAFQVAMCYMSGFGTRMDLRASAEFIQKAEERNHFAAKLFGQALRSTVSNSKQYIDRPSFETQVIRGFKLLHRIGPSVPLTVYWKSKDSVAPDNIQMESPGEDIPLYESLNQGDTIKDVTVGKVFPNYSEFRSWVFQCAEDESEPFLFTSTTSVTSTPASPKMNLLECAIITEDIILVKFLFKHMGLPVLGHLGDLPLITACRTGNIDVIRVYLSGYADISQKQPDGTTFFHWIFMLGPDVRFVSEIPGLSTCKENKLLDSSCVAPKVLHPQWPLQLLGSPLAFSIGAHSFTGTAALLQLGANPLAPIHNVDQDSEKSWWTPVHLAVKHHSPEMLVLLLLGLPRYEADLDAGILAAVKARLTKIPSISECLGGKNHPLTKALTNCRRRVSFTNLWDATIGCALSYSTTVERFAIHGTDHEERLAETIALLPVSCFAWSSKDGKTPLMQAIDFNDLSVVTTILRRVPTLASKAFLDPLSGESTFPVHFASQIAGHRDSDDALDILKALVQYGLNQMSLRDSKGKTPLHYSVTGSSDRATKWLIKNGCSVNTTDDRGQAALHSALGISNLVALLDAGAALNQQDDAGMAPIHVAVSPGSEDLVKKLIEHGASLGLKDKLGQTALHCAVAKRSREACTILLEAGAAVNSQTNSGDTPLHLAIQSTRSDIVKLLLDNGADISVTNAHLFTPLHQSVFIGDYICFNRLLDSVPQNSALVNAMDLKKRTPLHIAAAFLRINMAEKLLQHNAGAAVVDGEGSNAFHLVVESELSSSQADKVEFLDLLYTHWMTTAAPDINKSDLVAAQLNAENVMGKTPWDLAYQQKAFMLMDFLIVKGGFDVCRQLQMDGSYIGNKLLNWAIECDEWDFAITLLRHNSVLEMHPKLKHLHGQVCDDFYMTLRIKDKYALKKFLAVKPHGSLPRWLDGRIAESSLFRPWKGEER